MSTYVPVPELDSWIAAHGYAAVGPAGPLGDLEVAAPAAETIAVKDAATPHLPGRRFDLDEVIAACQRDDGTGFCLACGAEADGCEPDARGYKCEACGARRVYGAEEILLMGAG